MRRRVRNRQIDRHSDQLRESDGVCDLLGADECAVVTFASAASSAAAFAKRATCSMTGEKLVGP